MRLSGSELGRLAILVAESERDNPLLAPCAPGSRAKPLSYRDLLGIFFATHDPTTLNRQGNDAGPQYRSAIYFHSPEQERTAREVIAKLNVEGIFPGPIVTEVTALPAFYPAEEYHQRYYRQNPMQPYCAFVTAPKVAKFREKFAHLRKG